MHSVWTSPVVNDERQVWAIRAKHNKQFSRLQSNSSSCTRRCTLRCLGMFCIYLHWCTVWWQLCESHNIAKVDRHFMKTLRFHCFAPFKLLSHGTRRENMRNNVLLSTVESSCSSRRFNNCTASDKQCNVLGLKESIKGRLTLSTGHSRSQSQLLLNRSISCVKFPKNTQPMTCKDTDGEKQWV